MLHTLFGQIRVLARSATLVAAVVLLALMGSSAFGAPAALSGVFAPAAAPPTLVSYQGFVKVSGSPFTGTGYFKFAVMDAASGNGTTNYWANDGATSGEPSASVVLTVSGGLFDVMLGDTSLAGMTQPISQNAFNSTTTYLRVWFSQTAGGPFQTLDPNQRIGSAAYALRATRAESATDADQLGGVAAASYLQTTSSLNAPNLVGAVPLASIPPIPWSNLTSIPVGFADGTDNDTTYVAGSNLTLTGNTFALADNVSVTSVTASSSVKIGNVSLTCASGAAGTVRWSGTTLEVCDGSTWAAISTSFSRKAFRARLSSDVPLGSGWQAVSFGTEDFDDANAFSIMSYTVTSGPGTLYHFDCRVNTSLSGPAVVGVAIDLGGSTLIAESVEYSPASGYASRQVSADVKLTPGQQVRCLSYNSGGAHTVLRGPTGPGYAGTVFSGYVVY
jgi:hypothetical protein